MLFTAWRGNSLFRLHERCQLHFVTGRRRNGEKVDLFDALSLICWKDSVSCPATITGTLLMAVGCVGRLVVNQGPHGTPGIELIFEGASVVFYWVRSVVAATSTLVPFLYFEPPPPRPAMRRPEETSLT